VTGKPQAIADRVLKEMRRGVTEMPHQPNFLDADSHRFTQIKKNISVYQRLSASKESREPRNCCRAIL
jgi:hypothetical protein